MVVDVTAVVALVNDALVAGGAIGLAVLSMHYGIKIFRWIRDVGSSEPGWSSADQDENGWWYEHNSSEPGVRYYYDGPDADKRVER